MRVGVVGTGSMGKNHLRVIDGIPQLELTCAMDINTENLHTACENYSIKTFDNLEDMVDMVDAVMISTPTESHFSIAKFFLENNKNLLVEKPFTLTVAEADELIRFAEEKNLVVAVGHLERFNPAVQHIAGLVKKPLFIEIQRLGPFSPRSLDVDVVMDLMIHDIDIILQWEKSALKNVHAAGVPIISSKVDIANVRLEFDSGLVANVTASRVSQKKTRKLRIFQKCQYLSLDYKKKRVKIYRLIDGQINEEIPQIDPVEPLYNLWINFFKSVSTGQNYNVTGQDGRNALEIASRISASLKQNFAL